MDILELLDGLGILRCVRQLPSFRILVLHLLEDLVHVHHLARLEVADEVVDAGFVRVGLVGLVVLGDVLDGVLESR